MANQRFLIGNTKRFCLRPHLNKFALHVLVAFTILLSGCATSTTFRALDAETKKPIEGAVALAEWIGGRRMAIIAGPTSFYTTKLVEVVSDSAGHFTIPGAAGSLAFQIPHLKVYKAGYVGWDSRRIYLGCRADDITRSRTKKREDFLMKDQDIYLEPWKDEYSFISHGSFIQTFAIFDDVGMKANDSKYERAIAYEGPYRARERKAIREKGK